MNSKKGCTKNHGKSRQKELRKLFEMDDLIVSREDLHELYQREVGEFVEGITMLGIKAVIDAEVELRCGKPHDRSGDFDCYRQRKQKTGYVIINVQKRKLEKPRVVTMGPRKKEITLETYRKFQHDTVMEKRVLAKMLHGVSTRDYRADVEAIQDSYGIEKSSVSRHYIRGSAKMLKEFNERPIDRYFPIIFIDGYEIGGDVNVSPLLYKTVYSTNPIESLNSHFERFAYRVKRWRGGDMKKRWLAAAIVKAEERMHRVRGCLGIVALVKKMEEHLKENKKILDRRAVSSI